VASRKTRFDKTVAPAKTESADKPIRLNDLIPTRDVSGGRRTVFGSAGPKPAGKRKPHK
jgi:hypothetical protein